MFGLLFSELIHSDGDIEIGKSEIVKDSFKKESEKVVEEKETLVGLSFKTFWRKVKRCFFIRKGG